MTKAIHGRPGDYVSGCRCHDCVTGWRRYQKHWRYTNAHGARRLIPGRVIREHVTWLRSLGMSEREIAAAAGWSWPNSLRAALTKNTVRVDTAHRILNVGPQDRFHVAREFPGWMISRRLQALTALGWTTNRIATETGLAPECVRELRRGKDTVYRAQAQPIIDLFLQAGDVMLEGADADTARRLAQRRGWAPPAAWDDIDNPHEKTPRRIINVA